MCSISTVNILLYVKILRKPDKVASPSNLDYDYLAKWLGAPFIIQCAFRSFFPVIMIDRIVYIDHWLSSIFLGRLVSTICEISFIL